MFVLLVKFWVPVSTEGAEEHLRVSSHVFVKVGPRNHTGTNMAA